MLTDTAKWTTASCVNSVSLLDIPESQVLPLSGPCQQSSQGQQTEFSFCSGEILISEGIHTCVSSALEALGRRLKPSLLFQRPCCVGGPCGNMVLGAQQDFRKIPLCILILLGLENIYGHHLLKSL